MTDYNLREIRLDIARLSVLVAGLAEFINDNGLHDKEKAKALYNEALSMADTMIDKVKE